MGLDILAEKGQCLLDDLLATRMARLAKVAAQGVGTTPIRNALSSPSF